MSTARQVDKPGAAPRLYPLSGRIWSDTLSLEDWRKDMGGTGLGAKRCRAVTIVRGSRAVSVHDTAGPPKVADQISRSLRTTATTRSPSTPETQPSVVNLSCRGALPIENHATSVLPECLGVGRWEGTGLRDGFDHRGHQCDACDMHHCRRQVVAEGPHKGE